MEQSSNLRALGGPGWPTLGTQHLQIKRNSPENPMLGSLICTWTWFKDEVWNCWCHSELRLCRSWGGCGVLFVWERCELLWLEGRLCSMVLAEDRHCSTSHLSYSYLVWPCHSPSRGLMDLGRHVALLTKAEGRSAVMWPYEAGSQTVMAAFTSLPPGALAHPAGNSATTPRLGGHTSHIGRPCIRAPANCSGP